MDGELERILIMQIKKGDQNSFKIVFLRFYKLLTSFSAKITMDINVAEDIVQELFIKLWTNRDNLEIRGSLLSYLYRSARNESINYLKHKKVEEKYQIYINRFSSEEAFRDLIEEEEFHNQLYSAYKLLPPRCKQIFELSRIQEKSHEEIASLLSISKNTVKNQIVYALKIIRSELEKYEGLLIISLIIKLLAQSIFF